MANPVEVVKVILGHFGIGKGVAAEKKPDEEKKEKPKPRLGIAMGSKKVQQKMDKLKEAAED